MKYTGRMDEDFEAPDCPLLPDVLAESVANAVTPGNNNLPPAILARFRWVYHYNKRFGRNLVKRINGPSGGRDYLAMFFKHWADAFLLRGSFR